MLIGGLQKISMIDYPEKLAAVIFTSGCNFCCPYCHNPELNQINSTQIIDEDFIFNFLKTRINKLDAIVISGGEPTIQEDLLSFAKKIKNLGFLLKLDTNGFNPDIIKILLNENLLDYIAMDIKAPLEKYQTFSKENLNLDNILKSIKIIIKSNIDYEFRTTVTKSLLSYDDFLNIGNMLSGAKKYYLQKYVSCIKNDYVDETYSDIEFAEIINLLKPFIIDIKLR